jgi:hypothetical protein
MGQSPQYKKLISALLNSLASHGFVLTTRGELYHSHKPQDHNDRPPHRLTNTVPLFAAKLGGRKRGN